jgi:hypothetical protein
VTTNHAPSRARRCRHPSFAPTHPFLATARGRRPFRGLPPSDPAGPPNTTAGNALRLSPTFLLLSPHAASPRFESCRRAILEPKKLSGPSARLPHDPERRRVTTNRAPSRARRCRHPSFAPTHPFLATACVRRSLRGLPPSDPAGPPNTTAGKALRLSPAFLHLSPHAASPRFESCRRAIFEPLKPSGP